MDGDKGMAKLTTYTFSDAQHHVIKSTAKVEMNLVVALEITSGCEEEKRKWKATPIVLSPEESAPPKAR